MTAFEEEFRRLCENYCYEYSVKMRTENPDYAAAWERMGNLHAILCEKLGKDAYLANEYEDAVNYCNSFSEMYIYRQGSFDAVFLLRWLGLCK